MPTLNLNRGRSTSRQRMKLLGICLCFSAALLSQSALAASPGKGRILLKMFNPQVTQTRTLPNGFARSFCTRGTDTGNTHGGMTN